VNCVYFSGGSRAADWSPTSVFDDTDRAVVSPGRDVTDGTRASVPTAITDQQEIDMKSMKIRSEIVEVLMDRGEPRRAGIGLVGRLFHRKYRESRASKVEAQNAAIVLHR